MEPETFNIFHGLFEAGDYHVIVEKFISFLDLETLCSLCLCNKTCYKFLTPYISKKKLELRMFWLSPLQPQTLKFIQRKNIIRSIVVCDDFEMILVAFTENIGWNAYVRSLFTLEFSLNICSVSKWVFMKIEKIHYKKSQRTLTRIESTFNKTLAG